MQDGERASATEVVAEGIGIRVRQDKMTHAYLLRERRNSCTSSMSMRFSSRGRTTMTRRLPLHPRKRGALGLCLDHPDDALVDVEQVVGATVARLERDFAYCDAMRGKQVHRLLVLHRPAGLDELPVYEHASARLSRNATRALPH